MPVRDKSLQHRIVENSRVTLEGCWLWMRSHCNKGYGAIRVGDKILRAHRVSFEAFTGRAIGAHEQIDHTCRRTECVNPAHLECVPARENRYRQWLSNHTPENYPHDYQLE